MWRLQNIVRVGLGLFLIVCAASPVAAVPTLQLYIEGSTYDSADESWVIKDVSSFTLWVLGETDKSGTIFDVKLTAGFSSSITTPGTITLTPTSPSLSLPDGTVLLPAPAHTPSSLTPVPVVISPSSALSSSESCGAHGTVGTIPCMADTKSLPSHGEFGEGTTWVEFALGDFTLTTDRIGDFIDGVPTTWPALGEIKAYTVALSGFPEDTAFHFDAFGHTVGKKGQVKYEFAPFSHDAVGTSDGRIRVPLPSGLVLLLTGLLLLWVRALARKNCAAAAV